MSPAKRGARGKKPAPSAKEFVVNIDGASRGNPGPASIGYVIATRDGAALRQEGRPIGEATNNFAEYSALLAALADCETMGADRIEVKSDSELLVNQLNGIYKIKNENIKILVALAREKLHGFSKVTFTHVPREKNREADRLAARALDGFPMF